MAVIIVTGAHISDAEKIRDKLGCVAIVCDDVVSRGIECAVRSIVNPTILNGSGDPIDNPFYGKDILFVTNSPVTLNPNDGRIKAVYNHTHLQV